MVAFMKESRKIGKKGEVTLSGEAMAAWKFAACKRVRSTQAILCLTRSLEFYSQTEEGLGLLSYWLA